MQLSELKELVAQYAEDYDKAYVMQEFAMAMSAYDRVPSAEHSDMGCQMWTKISHLHHDEGYSLRQIAATAREALWPDKHLVPVEM